MAYRPHGRASVNSGNPRAFARCDRCGFIYNHASLKFQFDYRGPRLANLRILVCSPCYDKPQPQLKPILLTEDPLPVINARPEDYLFAETNVRTVSAQVLQPSAASGNGSTVTLTFPYGPTFPNVEVGSMLIVSGMVPETYNGTFFVTGTSVTPTWTISFASNAQGNMVKSGYVATNLDPTTGLPVINVDTRVTEDANTRTTQPIGIPTGLNQDAVMPLINKTAYAVKLPVVSVLANGTNIITVTCSTVHNLANNDQIAVEDLTVNMATGFYNVTVVNPTIFTYPVALPVAAGSLLTSRTNIITALVGTPLGYDQIPQTGT
jgi:hypothetical protein